MYFYFHIKQKRNQHKLIPFTLKFIEIKKKNRHKVSVLLESEIISQQDQS